VCVTTRPFQVSITFISVCCKLSEWESADFPGLVPLVHFMLHFFSFRFVSLLHNQLIRCLFIVRVFPLFLCITLKNSFMSFSVYIFVYLLFSILQYASLFYLWLFFVSLSLLYMNLFFLYVHLMIKKGKLTTTLSLVYMYKNFYVTIFFACIYNSKYIERVRFCVFYTRSFCFLFPSIVFFLCTVSFFPCVCLFIRRKKKQRGREMTSIK